MLFNAPINPGPKFSGVVGVLDSVAAPAGCPVDLAAARSQLVDAVVEVDDALMEKYLTEGTISVEELATALPKALAAGTVIPIFCTSVRKDKDIGVQELLDGLETYSPIAVARRRRTWLPRPRRAMRPELKPDPSGEFVGQVFKAVTDKFVGNMSFLRVYQGTYKADQPLVNARTDKSSRTGGLFDVQGNKTTPMTEAVPGDIVAVAKVEDLHIGDTVGNHAAPAEAAGA